MMLDALADGAAMCGMPKAKALDYAARTMAGAAQMAFMLWCMKRRGLAPGFTFRGWATEEDGEVVYSAAEVASAPDGTTLYSIWDRETIAQ